MSRFRSKKYLKWVSEQTCFVCGIMGPAQAHHIKGIGGMSGAGLKAPDWAVMPMCGMCHHAIHNEPHPEMIYAQWEAIVRTLGQAIDEGILQEGK